MGLLTAARALRVRQMRGIENTATENQVNTSTAVREGTIAPDFSLRGVDGSEHSLDELLRGRRGLALNFMRGTW